MGQEMAAMSAVFVNLLPLKVVKPPVTNNTGGTSVGNPNAGMAHTEEYDDTLHPATKADKIGAGFVTAVLLIGACGMFGVMNT